MVASSEKLKANVKETEQQAGSAGWRKLKSRKLAATWRNYRQQTGWRQPASETSWPRSQLKAGWKKRWPYAKQPAGGGSGEKLKLACRGEKAAGESYQRGAVGKRKRKQQLAYQSGESGGGHAKAIWQSAIESSQPSAAAGNYRRKRKLSWKYQPESEAWKVNQ